jgi:predicted 2-oxoglutarate/Fe(II)-dependent dioxygenase YbiX
MKHTLLTIPGFLGQKECSALIQSSEQHGYGAAPITTAVGFVMAPEVRNNTRVMLDQPEQAASLWSRLRQLDSLPTIDGWRPVGLNERLRFYRYTRGQAFRWHRDGAYVRNATERSLLTFMIYLNQDFTGGETEFEDERILPRTGDALVFTHGLRHQGAEVRRGTKYVLRSDVMYRRVA